MDDSHDEYGVGGLPDNGEAFSPSGEYCDEEGAEAVRHWRKPKDRRNGKNGGAALLKFRPKTRREGRGAEVRAVIVGSSPQARALRESIKLYATDASPVLIVGETGVGKELVARQLHALSDRRNEAFVPLNVGAIPETLAAGEFFGHEKGAFTDAVSDREGAFLAADGGVLFLDEIGDMPLSIQTHLLRVLDDGLVSKLGAKTSTPTDFRLICATNVRLQDVLNARRFRQDLYYRINVLVIDVPPLRARGDDVVEIAETMIEAHPNENFRAHKLTPAAADRLKTHRFPGNVRELRNVLARALIHARNGKVLPENLVFDEACGGQSPASFDVTEAKENIGRLVMLKALHVAGGNATQAAAMTGRSRGTLQALKKQLEGKDIAEAYRSVCADIKALVDDC